ncbi:hypothetical protein ACJW30_11G129800 [Castanea mollissima]
MSSWNDSIHFCHWRGVTCGRRHQRVTVLDLQSQKMVALALCIEEFLIRIEVQLLSRCLTFCAMELPRVSLLNVRLYGTSDIEIL